MYSAERQSSSGITPKKSSTCGCFINFFVIRFAYIKILGRNNGQSWKGDSTALTMSNLKKKGKKGTPLMDAINSKLLFKN